jgi:hypothetical protein
MPLRLFLGFSLCRVDATADDFLPLGAMIMLEY